MLALSGERVAKRRTLVLRHRGIHLKVFEDARVRQGTVALKGLAALLLEGRVLRVLFDKRHAKVLQNVTRRSSGAGAKHNGWAH